MILYSPSRSRASKSSRNRQLEQRRWGAHALSTEEGNLSGPLKATKTSKARNVLLAGTILPALAIPQWSTASPFSIPSKEGTIILAQGGPNDPKEKDKPKQQPKGAPPPKAAPPPAAPQAQPQRVQPPPAAALPKGPPPGPQGPQGQPQPRVQPAPGAAGLPKGPLPGPQAPKGAPQP